jgi:hypothetical protein
VKYYSQFNNLDENLEIIPLSEFNAKKKILESSDEEDNLG